MLVNLFNSFEEKLTNLKELLFTSEGTLKIAKYIPREFNGFYIRKSYPKSKIVLHHTVGNIFGDFFALTTRKNVGVAYLISRTGLVVELFDPKYWSNHLGKTALGGNETQSKMSIGIEISNYGYLIKKGDTLYTIYGNEYCKIEDTNEYEIKEYRGQRYWTKYTEEQYVAIKELLLILTKKFEIPYEFLPVKERIEYTKNVILFKGIVTHTNYRKDKWDVSPVFDWNKIAK